ncbi:hypothetical protein [Leptospira congkakensis]|uniref:hypothetical protein n=1 Tax=Leptospira congkakensis TaxID=2484932 RepID=UPI001FF00851|nr:hypothetical protein [Leptospira congkakensis]
MLFKKKYIRIKDFKLADFKKIFTQFGKNTEVMIFENESLVYFKLRDINKPIVKNYPYLDNLIQNQSTSYKWTISNFDELSKFINSIRSENKSFLNYFIRPKVLVLFPEDIFESERVFFRTLFEQFAREIFLIETFHVCQLSQFSVTDLVGKKILSIGERLNQSFTHVENSEFIESKILDSSIEKIQDSDFDLIISHELDDNTKFKSELFLHGEELRKNVIQGTKKYIEFLKI